MKRLRKRLTYANVMSSIAVFLVLGGGAAFAAGKLAKNSVGTKQLKNNAVTTKKIKNNAVTGAKVKESSLGTVPSATNATNATNAGNANTVNGQSISKILFRAPAETGTTTLFSGAGLTITASCSGLENITLTATTSKQDSSIYAISVETFFTEVFSENEESGTFDVGDAFDLLAGGDGNTDLITFEYDATDGSVVTGIINADEDGAPGGCRATGHVTFG